MNKFKSFFEKRKTIKQISQANDYYTIKPFLHGCQMENRRFANYIFVKNSATNTSTLEARNFKNLKESVTKDLDWNIEDELFDIVADNIQYNKKYNILITMVPEKLWATLNTAINIAEKTTDDVTTQRQITINTVKELAPS